MLHSFDKHMDQVGSSVGQTVACRYRLVRCLKTGGMGAVYEAIDTQTNRRRAVKVMLPGLVGDTDMQRRFLQEATVAGRVESDHIVEVFDVGFTDDAKEPFIVMELLRGEDLRALLVRQGRVAFSEAVAYLAQVALGLDKVHAEGIVHRDLKLENLFLTHRDDGTPQVKILDFGIAKVIAGDVATLQTTRALGTPVYMSPEQLSGSSMIDERSDLYSLGHVTYTLLVGAPYWEQEAHDASNAYCFAIQAAKGISEPATVRAARAQVSLPAGFDSWFAKACATVPTERFSSAADQTRALCAVLSLRIPEALLSDPEIAPTHASKPRPERSLSLGGSMAVHHLPGPLPAGRRLSTLAFMAAAVVAAAAFAILPWRGTRTEHPSSAAHVPSPMPDESRAAVPSPLIVAVDVDATTSPQIPPDVGRAPDERQPTVQTIKRASADRALTSKSPPADAAPPAPARSSPVRDPLNEL